MQRLFRYILLACLITAFLHPVVGEVVKLPLDTDSSWKCLDTEVDGWNTLYYDDSWWESAIETSKTPAINTGMPIWYPGEIKPKTAYFRYDFVIDGTDVISGNIYTGVARALNGNGYIRLYINGESAGTTSNTMYSVPPEFPMSSSPAGADITSYLHPGKNVIAAEVYSEDYAWALSGTIRYTKLINSGSAPAI